MIDLDEMKEKWIEYDRRLNESLALNRQLLNAVKLNGARSALGRMKMFAALEAFTWLAWMVVLGRFIYENIALPRFALPGVMLDAIALGNLVALIRQIAAIGDIGYGEPVTQLQKRVEALRISRIRRVQINLLAGMLAWIPLFIVALWGWFRVDAYRAFDRGWLIENLAFGLALIPLSIWVSKKYGDRMSQSPIIQRLMQDLAGRNLNAAARSLAELSQFEQDN
jgi:hypothetical protein